MLHVRNPLKYVNSCDSFVQILLAGDDKTWGNNYVQRDEIPVNLYVTASMGMERIRPLSAINDFERLWRHTIVHCSNISANLIRRLIRSWTMECGIQR